MPVCDICNATPGSDAEQIPAGQLRAAVDTGYRPAAVIEQYRRLASRLGLNLGDDHWYGEWVTQVRNDSTDWLLCRSCSTGLEAHLARPATVQRPAAQPAPEPRRRWLSRWWRR
jgi:hypothetical protein